MLKVDGLTVSVPAADGVTQIVRQASLSTGAGELVGLIGESGAGKSTLARAVLGLLPDGAQTSGRVLWDGHDVLRLTRREIRQFRARSVAMIMQDPRASVNPMHTIGLFVTEALRANHRLRKREALRQAARALDAVGLDGTRTLTRYPHQLSGGMLQRVVIAAALMGDPRLLVADEPTTALDVTSQAEIMAVLRAMARDHQLATLLVTHNLELAAAMCDRLYVMCRGEIVESGPAQGLLTAPVHPHTASLREATRTLSGLP